MTNNLRKILHSTSGGNRERLASHLGFDCLNVLLRDFQYNFKTPFQQCYTGREPFRARVEYFTFFQDHEVQCPYTKVQCIYPSCGVLVLREDLSRHLEEECMFRQQQCQYCKLMTTADQLKVSNIL